MGLSQTIRKVVLFLGIFLLFLLLLEARLDIVPVLVLQYHQSLKVYFLCPLH